MNRTTAIIIGIALVIGQVAGYYFFGGESAEKKESTNQNAEKEQTWTCSMHPQIRQNEPGDCPICGMDLIPLDETNSGSQLVFEMTKEAIQLANIQTTRIDSSYSGGEAISLNGKIEANETKVSNLVSHLAGRIEALHLSFVGEKVNKGQRIATVYSPQLITTQRELLEAKKLEKTQPKLFEAVWQKLKYWKLEDSQIENILNSGKVLETFDIYSEYSGYVEKRNVAVGDYLKPGTVLFQVKNLNTVWVIFEAYESHLPAISVGQPVEFTSPATGNKKYTSVISYVDPEIDIKSRVAGIRAEVDSDNERLKPGMFVTGKIVPGAAVNRGIMVPKSAVLWTGERSVVYLKVPGTEIPSFEFREVSIAGTLGKHYMVTDGLAFGDEVVTNGAFVIDASAQLNNQASMMNRLVGNSSTPNHEDEIAFTGIVPREFNTQYAEAIYSYLKIKDLLVSADGPGAQEESGNLEKQLEAIDMKLLTGDAHMYWMDLLESFKTHLRLMQSAKNLESVRDEFANISELMINASKAYGVNTDLFIQHCPMALDNAGANWLSLDQEIRNPYFGDKMLKCGEVAGTILMNSKTNDFDSP